MYDRSLEPKGTPEKIIGKWHIFIKYNFSNLKLKDMGGELVSSSFLQNTKFCKIVMRFKLSIFGMLFHGALQSYSRTHKQNTKPESKWQEVISIFKCYKDFQHLEQILTFLSLFMGMDLVMMSGNVVLHVFNDY